MEFFWNLNGSLGSSGNFGNRSAQAPDRPLSFRVWSDQFFSAAFRVALPWRRITPLFDHRLQESFDVIHKAFVGSRDVPWSRGVTIIEKLHQRTKALESDTSSGQGYSKRHTEKLKTPDVQTVALRSPAELPRDFLNPVLTSQL
jgi:hypothetical protein